ncbi:YolD-like family protein [Anaerobacillus alkaliphilus]|uniref:YolD-like family protein n=1 Tax=Anaerobacillus alkaliphilus TaxID=1548597 RepID=A0A4Q0VMS8_9BACI|nr:YolD-like family protein [Anaerobacillus alkaliphilus]RXI96433.1 YolD-like family protein [Anaerobacillus alkaliphilus]
MTIRDRGNIKWTSMMLPEHVAMVREIYANQYKVAKPQLDEQEIEELERVIGEGMREQATLVFTYWSNGYYKTFMGKVYGFNQMRQSLKILDQFGDRVELKMSDLIDVRIGD